MDNDTTAKGRIIATIVVAAILALGLASIIVLPATAQTAQTATTATIVMPQGVGSSPSLTFSPSTLTVVAGTTITFSDQDTTAPHDVIWETIPVGASVANSPQVMEAGDSFTVVLMVPGTYTYFCAFHAWMHGSITVVAAGASGNLTTTNTSTTPPPTPQVSLQVSSVDQSGNNIYGYHVEISQGTALVDSGFTTYVSTYVHLLTPGQTYEVTVDPSYGGCTFSKWQDTGSANPSRSIVIASNIQLTAVYTCSQSKLRVVTQESNGTSLTGYAAQLLLEGGALQTAAFQNCYSPCAFTVDNGQTYQVKVDDFGAETFSHWSDDKGYLYYWGGLYPVTIPGGSGSTTVTLTAVYAPTKSSTNTTTTVASPVTSTSSSSSTAPSGTTAIIIMPQGVGDDPTFNFSPSTLTVTAGTTIVFSDNDSQSRAPHNVTWETMPAGASVPNSPVVMGAGQTFSVTLTVPGAYTYHCTFHSWMSGSITVVGANATTGTATSSSASSTSASGSNASATITMPQNVGVDASLNFSPASLTVAAGTAVTFVDQDNTAPHNVFWVSAPAAASPGPANSPLVMISGQTFSVTLTIPGIYKYECLFHSAWMQGTIVVTSASSMSNQISTSSTSVATSTSTVVSTVTGSANVTTSGAATVDMPQGAGEGNNFSPASITITPGTVVTFVDEDSTAPHNVVWQTVPSGVSPANSGQIMTQGQTFSVTLTVPGTYKYYCQYHSGWMHGTVIVS